MTTLGEIAIFEMGQSPNSSFVNDRGHGMPFLQGNGEFGHRYPSARLACTQPAKVCRPGDILVSVRAPVGALNIADQTYCIGRGLAAIRLLEIDSAFGWHALNYWVTGLHKFAQGTAFEAVGKHDLQSLELLQLPLPERRRVAEILDTIDGAIQQTEALIAKLKEMKQGLLQDLLTRGLDENGELRDPAAHPEQFKDSPLGRIPRGWDVRRLGNLCTLLNGLAFKPEDWAGIGLPIIRIQNLNGGTDYNFFAGNVREDYIIPAGTLLFSWSGSRGTSFGPFIWPGPQGVLNQHIFRVTAVAGVRQGWLYFALDDVKQRVERHAHGGSGLVHVRRGDLENYLIATPHEAEQARIEDTLSAYDNRIRDEEAACEKLRLLKKGMMQDLLTGRVRVSVSETHPEHIEADA